MSTNGSKLDLDLLLEEFLDIPMGTDCTLRVGDRFVRVNFKKFPPAAIVDGKEVWGGQSGNMQEPKEFLRSLISG